MRLSRRALWSKELPLGNIVNPRASNPLQREDFRAVAPASQPEYRNEATAPVKTHDVATIAYAKVRSRNPARGFCFFLWGFSFVFLFFSPSL